MIEREQKELVLIHGWGFGGRVWESFVPYLERQWRVKIINLPGYEEPEKINYSKLDQVVNVISPEIQETATIVAWSLGGLIATKLASIRKDVKALLLVACNPCFIKKPDWPHGLVMNEFKKLGNRLSTNKDKALQEFAGLIAMGDKHPRKTIAKLRKLIGGDTPSFEILNSGLDLLEEEDLRTELANLRCPTGMIFGENDVLAKSMIGPYLQALRDDICTIEINDTGHAPFLTRPREMAEAIERLAANFYQA